MEGNSRSDCMKYKKTSMDELRWRVVRRGFDYFVTLHFARRGWLTFLTLVKERNSIKSIIFATIARLILFTPTLWQYQPVRLIWWCLRGLDTVVQNQRWPVYQMFLISKASPCWERPLATNIFANANYGSAIPYRYWHSGFCSPTKALNFLAPSYRSAWPYPVLYIRPTERLRLFEAFDCGARISLLV